MRQATSQLQQLASEIDTFVSTRGFQGETPKNLAMALIVETAELVEILQWSKTGDIEELTPEAYASIRHEAADVLIYLLALSKKLNFDLLEAGFHKMRINESKYPIKHP